MWYRANFPPEAFVADPPVLAPIQAPTPGVWSSGDHALSERRMTNSATYCVNGFYYVRLEELGHWLPLEAPRAVSDEIVKFLRLV